MQHNTGNEVERRLNRLIGALAREEHIKTDNISDGYHTFKEVYDHRIALFIALVNVYTRHVNADVCWKSAKHSDGSYIDGWFIAGMISPSGKQIGYHLPIEAWDLLICRILSVAPDYDFYTSQDVLDRLKEFD